MLFILVITVCYVILVNKANLNLRDSLNKNILEWKEKWKEI